MRRTRRTKTVLITGASGFLGRHVRRAAWPGRWDIITPPSRSLDVVDRGRLLQEIREWKPEVIVHLAYRKDHRTIVFGSTNVAEAAAACGARLIHMSTDVVFRGRPQPYTEVDGPDATFDYGRWKGEAELAVAAAAPSAVLVRTSLLYGEDIIGSSQHDLIDAVEGTRPMAFFIDEVRCPTFAGDVAAAVVALAGLPDVTGPLHVAGPEALSRYDTALALARHLGLDRRAVRAGSDAGSGRPDRVVLDCAKAIGLGFRLRPISAVLG